jgi:hypothetical protein
MEHGREHIATPIEAPWLVNGGHGASLWHHNDLEHGREHIATPALLCPLGASPHLLCIHPPPRFEGGGGQPCMGSSTTPQKRPAFQCTPPPPPPPQRAARCEPSCCFTYSESLGGLRSAYPIEARLSARAPGHFARHTRRWLVFDSVRAQICTHARSAQTVCTAGHRQISSRCSQATQGRQI